MNPDSNHTPLARMLRDALIMLRQLGKGTPTQELHRSIEDVTAEAASFGIKIDGLDDSIAKPVKLYWEASATNEFADSPEWAEVSDARAMLKEAKRLQALTVAQRMSHAASEFFASRWQDDPNGAIFNMRGEQINVNSLGRVWLSCYPKHGTYLVETKAQYINDIEAALAGVVGEIYIAGSGNPDDLRSRIEEVRQEQQECSATVD